MANQTSTGISTTRAQKAVLVQLESQGNRITTLALRLGISKQATSKLVQDLEGKKLVTRVPDPDDSRASLIQFTDAGKAVVETTVLYFEDLELKLGAQIGREDLNLVKAKLKQVANIMDPHGF
ncbi:MarR family winged helix-turn-helix transcriptional regulator [Ruegeria meonggei]|uniref:MarR family winged helix-turn-helix transcriptional regulator n=1 Tax=Ruegeria meonggei TaxID=1446476 RepID=UPI003672A23C